MVAIRVGRHQTSRRGTGWRPLGTLAGGLLSRIAAAIAARTQVPVRLPTLLVAAVAIVVLGCGGPTAQQFEATLDALDLPAWQLTHTTVASPDGPDPCVRVVNPYCPSIRRYYAADADPAQNLRAVKDAVVAAGFAIEEELHPECDQLSSGPVCSLAAVKDGARLEVNVHPPGEDVDHLGIAVDDLSIVRITVRPS